MRSLKDFLTILRAKIGLSYANFAFRYIKTNDKTSQLPLAGQASSLGGPHFARGPYVVHAGLQVP